MICKKLKRRCRTFIDFFGLMMENGYLERQLNWWERLFAYFLHAFETVEFSVFQTEAFLSGFYLSKCLNLSDINVKVIKKFRRVVVKIFQSLIDFIVSSCWWFILLLDYFLFFVCCWTLIIWLSLFAIRFLLIILILTIILESWMHVLGGLF